MTTLTAMRTLVRRDMKDEDAQDYRWTNDELDRAIARALAELSRACPREMKSTIATTNGSREVDISTLTDRVSVDKVEFPIDEEPRSYQRFTVYGDILTLIGGTGGDGEDCYIYWSKVHTLDGSASTLPSYLEDVLALGASAYAALSQAQYSSDRANTGGDNVDRDYSCWARDRLKEFKEALRQYGKKGKLRQSTLYPATDHEGSDYE